MDSMMTSESADAQGETTLGVGQRFKTSEDVRRHVESLRLGGRRSTGVQGTTPRKELAALFVHMQRSRPMASGRYPK
ncbi:unnamed protein product [Phaeothamnion confervicola]